MDYEQKKIREIRDRLAGLNLSELDLAIRDSRKELPPFVTAFEAEGIQKERQKCYKLLDQWESRYLLKKAESYGIEVPQKPEWRKVELKEDKDGNVIQVQAWLNEAGKAMITRQIREARRANVKWWVDILIPVLALAVAFLALFKDIIIEVLKRP